MVSPEVSTHCIKQKGYFRTNVILKKKKKEKKIRNKSSQNMYLLATITIFMEKVSENKTKSEYTSPSNE